MSTPPPPVDPRPIIARIDAAIRELEALRRQLIAPAKVLNLTEQMFGALGQGTWEEYETDLDWLRFSAG